MCSKEPMQLANVQNIINYLFGGQPAAEDPPKAVNRKVFTLSNKVSSRIEDAQLLRGEGDDSSGDAAVDKCYEFFGDAFKFFYEVFNRNSIDDKGLMLIGLVHYGTHVPNANWDNTLKLLWFGDGFLKDPYDDTKPAPSYKGYFGSFSKSIEIVAHELMHGITNALTSLNYYGESGALSEHLSDAFGLMVKHYTLKQKVDEADWLLGQDIILPELPHMAFRSFKNPGSAYRLPGDAGHDEQVAKMKDYKNIKNEDGGAHINSGIPNHAFYLAAIKIGGYSWEKLGRVWWKTLKEGDIPKFCKFKQFALKTVDFAREEGDNVQNAITEAWQAVGVLQPPSA